MPGVGARTDDTPQASNRALQWRVQDCVRAREREKRARERESGGEEREGEFRCGDATTMVTHGQPQWFLNRTRSRLPL